jgi:hypothetical protein
MAGDIVVKDKITGADIRNLKAFGVGVIVKVDLSHAKEEKPMHLEIELDFTRIGKEKKEILEKLSPFKQKYGSTYSKFRFGEFAKLSGELKKVSAKYEVAAFGGSVLADASNARGVQEAIQEAKDGAKKGMIEVKY